MKWLQLFFHVRIFFSFNKRGLQCDTDIECSQTERNFSMYDKITYLSLLRLSLVVGKIENNSDEIIHKMMLYKET